MEFPLFGALPAGVATARMQSGAGSEMAFLPEIAWVQPSCAQPDDAQLLIAKVFLYPNLSLIWLFH